MIAEGTILENRYRLESFVGEGGMCSVFRAVDVTLGRVVAIKVLRPTLLADADTADAIRRLQREAQAVALLRHPNILEAYGFGIFESQPYIVIEFLEGDTLADVIKREGGLSKERFLRIALQVCDALSAAHQSGVLHRDLKPSNIMLLADDRVKVVDFGIAKVLPQSGKELQQLTQSGEIFGSVAYMGPERFTGTGGGDDVRSDIYSLGCMLYEMLTGRAAFSGDQMELVGKHLEETPDEDPRLGEFSNVVFHCLQKKLEDRPGTIEEVREELMAPNTVPASVKVRVAKAKPKFKLGKAHYIAAVVLALLVFGIEQLRVRFLSFHPDRSTYDDYIKQADRVQRSDRPKKYAESARLLEHAMEIAPQIGVTEDAQQRLRARLAYSYIQANEKKGLDKVVAELRAGREPENSRYDPKYIDGVRRLGDYYLDKGNAEEALFWYKREWNFFGEENSGRRFTMLRFGKVEFERGNFASAVSWSNACMKASGETFEQLYQRALLLKAAALYAMNDFDKSDAVMRELKSITEIDDQVVRQIPQLEGMMAAKKPKDRPLSAQDMAWLKRWVLLSIF